MVKGRTTAYSVYIQQSAKVCVPHSFQMKRRTYHKRNVIQIYRMKPHGQICNKYSLSDYRKGRGTFFFYYYLLISYSIIHTEFLVLVIIKVHLWNQPRYMHWLHFFPPFKGIQQPFALSCTYKFLKTISLYPIVHRTCMEFLMVQIQYMSNFCSFHKAIICVWARVRANTR